MLIKIARVFMVLIALLLLFASPAQTLGIGVAPSRLELEAYPLGSATSLINVINASSEQSFYQVYVEGDCEEWFSITPTEFVLDGDNSQEVQIVVSPSLTAAGEQDVDICVVSLVSASELKVGCGVKIPVHIRIVSPPPLAVMGIDVTGTPLVIIVTIVALLVLALVIGIVIWRRRGIYER
jgi:hypothetical protein